MKKIFSYILIILLFSIIGSLGGIYVNKTPTITLSKSLTSLISLNINFQSIPDKLLIPALGVNAQVEIVGLDKEQRMDVPKNVYNVGWYKYGPKPGEVGNSVIDGHVDTPWKTKSVFANLSDLKQGDIIEILDKRNRKYTFKVKTVTNYPSENLPMEEIFGRYSKPRLNLITCSGVYDRTSQNYTQRTVVYSELVE